jgi:hypothetical protein
MALDDERRDAEPSADPDVEAYEKERDADRARALVRKMKQMQRVPPPPVPSKPSGSTGSKKTLSDEHEDHATSSGEDLSTSSSGDDSDLPDKTIGRMR